MSTTVPATAGPALAFVRRRPLAAFLLWFFTVGQAFAFVPLLLDVPSPQLFVDLATLVGLLLPTLVITRIVDGPAALRALLRSTVAWRVAPRWYVLALAVVPLVALALALLVDGPPTRGGVAAALGAFGLQLVLALVFNNWWEEVAWAGFVGVRLQKRFGSTRRAAFVAGPLFALQHVSLVVDAGPVAGAVLLIALAALVVPFRMLTGWVLNRTGSLFVVGLLHAAGDAAAPGSGFGSGALGQLYPGTATTGSIHVVGLAVIGLVVLAATGGRLGHRAGPLTPPAAAP